MSTYICDQCESKVETVSFVSGETYICPICSEVSFKKIHKESTRKESLEIGGRYHIEDIGFVKIIGKNDHFLEFEEPDDSVTSMSYEEFLGLVSPEKAMTITTMAPNDNVPSNNERTAGFKKKPEKKSLIKEVKLEETTFDGNSSLHENRTNVTKEFAFDSLGAVRKKLIDLTNRNNLLNYRHPRASCIRIIDELPDQIVEVLSEEKSFTFIPVSEPTESELIREGFIQVDPVTHERKYLEYPTAEQWAKCRGFATSYDLPNKDYANNGESKHCDTKLQTLMYAPELESRCRSVRSKSETAIEESGANILYLILGFLEWRESRGSDVVRRAPLFTLPVKMEREKFDRGEGTFRYTIILTEDGLLTNVPLREKLKNDFGLNLPELTGEETPEVYFEKISKTILQHHPDWKLRRQATLALLNFSKQVMYEDLNPAIWPPHAAIEKHPIIKHFFSSAGSEFSQSDFGYSSEHEIDKVEDIHNRFPLIYEADSSQHSALIDAVDGKNVVIEGPPGSGKSQTITNLIAASIANGKKVLFVAEKMAALNVVKNRLDRAGLGDFCLELHSHKTQKSKIMAALGQRINKQGRYRNPKNIDIEVARYEDLKEKLQRYVDIINQPWKETGLTIHEILNKATRYREELGVNPDNYKIEGINGKESTPTRQKELLDQTEFLADVYDQVAAQSPTGTIEGHYWAGCNCTEIYGYETGELSSLLADWTQQLTDLADLLRLQIPELQLGFEVNSSLSTIRKHIEQLSQLPNILGSEPLSCVPSLVGFSERLESFVAEYNEIHEINVYLSEYVNEAAIAYPKETAKIKNVIHVLEKWGSSGELTIEELNADLSLTTKLIAVTEKIEANFSRITGKVPSSLEVALKVTPAGLKEFQTLVRLIDRLPNELWQSRDQLYDDEDLDLLLKHLNSHLKVLIPLHSRLIDVFSLHRLPNQDVLVDAWSEYQAEGFFRLFSSKWRDARRTILSLASSKKISKKEIFGLVPDLIEYVKEVTAINGLNQEKEILGDLFRGVETPLEKISAIRAWYKEVRKEYGRGFGERAAIGDALLTLDRNIALGIRDYAKQELLKNIDDLFAMLAILQRHYPRYVLLSKASTALSGEQSVLLQLVETLKNPVLNVLQVVKSTKSSYSDLLKLHTEITELHLKNKEWNNNSLKKLLKKFDFELSVFPGSFSKEKLEQGNNLCKIIRIVNEAPSLRSAIFSRPDLGRYRALQDSLPILQQVLTNVEGSKRAFYARGNVCETEWYESSDGLLLSLIEKNRNALAKGNWLMTWIDYKRVKERLTSEGLEEIINKLEQKQVASQNLKKVLSLCIHHQLAKEIFTEHQYLSNFSGLEQNAIRKKFREYDHKLQLLQREKIAFRASRVKTIAGVASGKVSDYTEMGLIKNEVGKKKRHIPVRSLIRRAGKSIQALTPCFMMSPMSVAQYLKPGCLEFDLVVMDEASQIRPEDALGAIARGKSFVVVGDPKQLPPTSFFQKVVDPDNDVDTVALEESESILDSVLPMFKNRRLRWHYRSRHESLIAFSNQNFYDSDLILFPSPFQKTGELGIRYVRLENGRFHNRRNVEEASAIVEQIVTQIIDHPDESVGIVAMNSEQRDEIEQQLDQQLKENHLLRSAMDENRASKEPLFIKNLENVQGDERDIVYISMTYGPAQIGGRLMQRFGPINSDVGWRRLNVLFTRSKKRMRIFSSMDSSDILLSSSSSRGVKSLRAFLEYCEKGHLHPTVYTGKEADSDFEVAVMRALDEYGFDCEPQVGVAGFFIDLAVKDPVRPGRFLMGIECDGATYHSAKSARDRDRLRQDILEDLGWNISRIWSTDWFKNPEACLIPIVQELESLKTVESEGDFSIGGMPSHDDTEEVFQAHQGNLGDKKEDHPQFLTLEDRLLRFHRDTICKEQPEVEPEKQLLRKALLDSLLAHQPCSKGEFLELIPMHLRRGTAASQGRYIEPVCKLIADYGD